ncbi:ATP-binding protein [Isoptericola sp. BMS4]|nr:ATP-binding protein [Isoptericola sp. BMS4]
MAAGSRESSVAPTVVGQREAVDALLVAAAGGHHMLISGPPDIHP